MACLSLRFSSSVSAMMIEVPVTAVGDSEDAQIQNRAIELPRYAILARCVFEEMYETVYVTETDPTKSQQLSVGIRGEDLDAYSNEQAGLFDLLNDSKWTLRGNSIQFKVDFDALRRFEDSSAADPFPRRERPPRRDGL
jgi:hypothetical protein